MSRAHQVFRWTGPHPLRPLQSACLLALTAGAVASCDKQTPTGTDASSAEPSRVAASGAGGEGDMRAATGDVTTQGTIPLPINQSVATAAPNPAFSITQTGTGPDGVFKITNSTSPSNALVASTSGKGRAGSFQITNSSNVASAVFAQTNGTGSALQAQATGFGTAGTFQNTNPNNGSNTLTASAAGPGNAISAFNTGEGTAGNFAKTSTTSSGAALFAQNAGLGNAVEGRMTGRGRAGYFENLNSSNGVAALFARTTGIGVAANFVINNRNSLSDAAFIYTDGSGWAGHFRAASSTGKGVLIETEGGAGLQVIGGSKNAVVGTSSGARALYTEESAEVWFTDYGFARLWHGRVWVPLDVTFGETVALDEPYHVFLEEYGDADLRVARRTTTGFEVVLRDGDPSAEFSYRIVAKRKGFEGKRLERAPWADRAARRIRR